MDWFIGAFVFLTGIIIGSFLNVCVYRIPLGISIAKGFSACPSCGARLTAVDLVPVFSFAVLRGKCRHCGARISPVYPLVEAATGILFVLLYMRFGLSYDLLIYAALVALLIVIALIDYKHMMIPNGLIIAGLAVGAAKLAASIFTQIFGSWTLYVIGFAAGALPLLLILLFCAWVLKKEEIGGGDIKLMAFTGLVIGWQLVIPAYLIGIVVGALVGVILMATGKKKRGDEIPFGPFLCFGILISVFFGYDMIHWYLGLLS
jgi:leader peptidase (prepilin peptidase)/N-methyltransferase